MSRNNFITAIDIGTENTKILVVEKTIEGEDLKVVYFVKEKTFGVRKGIIISPEDVSEILQKCLLEIDEKIGQKIESACVSVNGSHLFSLSSRGTIAVSRADKKISEDDMQRALQAAKTFSLFSNREIIEASPKNFIIDGEQIVKDPLGLDGVRLEAETLVLGGFSPYLKNVTQSVLGSGLHISDMIPCPVADARALLTPRQKELGVAVLDIGAGATGLAIYEEGSLVHLSVLPVGSNNITNDIAIGLTIDADVAEKIKKEYGSCSSTASKKIKVEIGESEALTFSHKALSKIISARVSEIFREVQKELKKVALVQNLPAGIVITGGGAKIPRILELAKKEFKLPCKLGKPSGFIGLDEDPSLSTVCGLALLEADMTDGENSSCPENEVIKNLWFKIKKMLKALIP